MFIVKLVSFSALIYQIELAPIQSIKVLDEQFNNIRL
jgi:hypothetical protein